MVEGVALRIVRCVAHCVFSHREFSKRDGDLSPSRSLTRQAAGAASSTGDRASAAKEINPRMRPGGTSRGQYHSPRFERRSQRRGTSFSTITRPR